jgi:hypothetical protein
MKKSVSTLVVLAILAYAVIAQQGLGIPGLSTSPRVSANTVQNAYDHRQSNLQIGGHGIVSKVLSDDKEGSRHQRFILEMKDGLIVLVAHNIDLAPRVRGLKKGDTIEFFGEYEWNQKGGVLHWTHNDPGGHHPDGWLKHDGQTYR